MVIAVFAADTMEALISNEVVDIVEELNDTCKDHHCLYVCATTLVHTLHLRVCTNVWKIIKYWELV